VRSLLERYWFAVTLSIGIIVWALRTRRRSKALRRAFRVLDHLQDPSVPFPFRGADFAAKVGSSQRFHSEIGA